MDAENRDINSIAMEVIMDAGDGREKIDLALEEMAKANFVRAKALLEEAEKSILNAHNAQTDVIQGQVSGEKVEYSLLFVHAQDTIMTITTELRMAQKMMPIFEMLYEKAGQ